MLEEPIGLSYEGKELLGIKHNALYSENNPCVIFLHGIPGDRVDSKQLPVKIAREINKLGFSAYRFDFVSFGVSPGNFYEYTLADQEKQMHIIIDYAMSQTDNNGSVILVAFSEAAKIAIKTAVNDKRVAGICLCNGVIAEEIETIRINRFYKEADSLVYDINCGVWLNKKLIDESKEYIVDVETLKGLHNLYGVYGNGDELAKNSLELMRMAGKKVVVMEGVDHLYTRHDWEKKLIEYIVEYLGTVSMAETCK